MTPEREKQFKELEARLLNQPEPPKEEQEKINAAWQWALSRPKISEGG